MSHQFIDPMRCDSLAFLMESVASKILRSHEAAICLEIDIDVKLGLPASAETLCELVGSLIKQSLEEMPHGGDLSITGVTNRSGAIELEIADTGTNIETRPQSRPMAAARIDAELQWQDCPQGGGAVTICFASKTGEVANGQRKVA